MSFVEDATVVTSLIDDVTMTTAVIESPVVSTVELAGGAASGEGGLIPGDDALAVFARSGTFGSAKLSPQTSSGLRQRLVDVPRWQFSPGMGPFFSTVLPDGTVAMPQIQLSVNQVTATGRNMACAFFHPYQGFYEVQVPTSAGKFECLQVNSISGVVADVGGADLCDSTVVYEPSGTPVLFCLSAFPYKGWRISTNGVWPVLAAFVLDQTSGRWKYDESRSIFPSTLRASDPTHGAQVWPNQVNFYGETVTQTLLPAELVTLPKSGHVAISLYAPRFGLNSGSVLVVDTLNKIHKAWFEWPNMVDPYGWPVKAFTRDINADPTSAVNDERIVINHDAFVQPNEKWNVTVHADSGTWRVSWGGVFTVGLPVGVRAEDVRAALEAIPAIGAGNVSVRESRPFLVQTYVVYEIEMVGPLAHLNLTATATTLDTSSLVNNGTSGLNRWQHGGTGFTQQSNFPFTELTYNAGAGTLALKTVPMFLQQGTEDPVRGYVPDASAGMTWYTGAGDLLVSASGHSSNPQMLTSFRSYGLHVWRKVAGGDRGYVAQATPTADWEDRYGEARPTPDFLTTPIHSDSNAFVLGMAEDQATGSVVVPTASGVLLELQPWERWVHRSGYLFRPATFAGAGDIAGWAAVGGSGTLAFDAGESSMRLTTSSSSDGFVQTPTGVSGLVLDPEWAGEVIHIAVESKAATVRRLVRIAVRFWSSGGAEVATLTGYGQAVSYNSTTGYRRIVGAALVPAGAAFLSMQIELLDPAGAGEVHHFRKVEAKLAPFWPSPAKDNLGTVPLYAGQPGGSWMAKGFVDPKTRCLWVPYLQVLSQAVAKNVRHPAWLARFDCSRVFTPRDLDGRALTAAQWTRQNLTLAAGETGHESDTRKHKVGDGSTAWVDLGYGTV